MKTCPCCSDVLLRHLSAGHLYLLCQHCKIEIPVESKQDKPVTSDLLLSAPTFVRKPSRDNVALSA